MILKQKRFKIGLLLCILKIEIVFFECASLLPLESGQTENERAESLSIFKNNCLGKMSSITLTYSVND